LGERKKTMNSARCPNCKSVIQSVAIESIPVVPGFGSWGNYGGVSYSCPLCKCILSVGIDPLTIMHLTIDGLVERLGKGGPGQQK
jgi:hypothetical protein